MARGAKHYNGARNEGSKPSFERRGRGRGGRRGGSRLDAKPPPLTTAAPPLLSSSGAESYRQKRSRSEPDVVPEDIDEDVSLDYVTSCHNRNTNERKPNNQTPARASRVGKHANLAAAAVEAVSTQAAISSSLAPATITIASNAASSLSRALPGTMELAFWRRLVDCERLVDSLKNSGAALIASDAVDASAPTWTSSEMCLFSVGEDRLQTCIQAILDLKGLVTYRCRHEGDPPLLMDGWYVPCSHFRAVVALARLCEAAIPTRFPPLVPTDVVSPPNDALEGVPRSSNAAAEIKDKAAQAWWPSPVALTAVQERLTCARRVRQLRYAYSVLVPLVRHCNTSTQLTELLMPPSDPSPSSHTGKHKDNLCNDSNRFVPLSGTPPHRVEGQILSELLLQANQDSALDTESWGAFAMLPMLKVRNGIYTVHGASRQDALELLLKREEELYGLPPFLRFIRRADSGSVSAYHHHGDLETPTLSSLPTTDTQRTAPASSCGLQDPSGNGVRVCSRSSLSNSSRSCFFPSPESLNCATFAFPDTAYYPTVQEELIDIAAKHGCFGLIIGEADHILRLWWDWVRYRTHIERHQWKQEHDQDDSASPAAMETETKRGALGDSAIDEIRQHNNRGVKGGERQSFPSGGAALLPRDPLLPFVCSAMDHDRKMRKKFPSEAFPTAAAGGDHRSKDSRANEGSHSVFWLSENRWSTKTLYYGLVFEVVLQSGIGSYDQDDGVTPLLPLDVDSLDDKLLHKNCARGPNTGSPLVYYPICLLELSR